MLRSLTATAHRQAPVFTDYQVRELARLQLAQRLAGVPVVEVARVRNPVVVVAEKHGRPWVAAAGVPPGHGGVPPGHGGVPPGQAKKAVAPGHREEGRERVVIKEEAKGEGHEKEKGPKAEKEKGDHGEKGEKGDKGKGKGHGKE